MDKHIEKILHKSNYKINNGFAYNRLYESPYSIKIEDTYINEDDEDEDDEIVELEDSEDNNISNNQDNTDELDNSDDNSSVEDKNINNDIDVIKQHNEIIKSTLTNLKNVYSKIGDIDVFIKDMDIKFDNLNKKAEDNQQVLNDLSKIVEEMREPTNKEKLEKAKFDSAPFNNNMNDIWGDKKYITNNIMKLKDGTFIGVFDNFDNINNVNDTFYEYE